MALGEPRLPRVLVGILASHEDGRRHDELVGLLDELSSSHRDYLRQCAFVFTGGTFRRVLEGRDLPPNATRGAVNKDTRKFLFDCGVIRLPEHGDGGVVFLAYLVVQRRVGIVWSFLTPITSHWVQPENNALTRLCDYWHVDRLVNAHSIRQWFPEGFLHDYKRLSDDWPPRPVAIKRRDEVLAFEALKGDCGEYYRLDIPKAKASKNKTRVALIAHDAMKERMAEFARDHARELDEHFDEIVTTRTTGREVEAEAPALKDKIRASNSGPKGGDIEIATEVMLGLIDVVIFFVDPLHPHPHIDDIRVVFGACMMNEVQMPTNEMQARAFMRRL